MLVVCIAAEGIFLCPLEDSKLLEVFLLSFSFPSSLIHSLSFSLPSFPFLLLNFHDFIFWRKHPTNRPISVIACWAWRPPPTLPVPWLLGSLTCSCCWRARSICCRCFSICDAASFFCSSCAARSCSRKLISWVIMVESCRSFSARLSGVPKMKTRGNLTSLRNVLQESEKEGPSLGESHRQRVWNCDYQPYKCMCAVIWLVLSVPRTVLLPRISFPPLKPKPKQSNLPI